MLLFDTKVKSFVQEQQQPQRQQQQPISVDDEKIVSFSVPFKDQNSCDDIKKHLNQLNKKIDSRIEPVSISRKLATQFGAKEKKHTIVSRQNVVYSFKCDLCKAGYVGYTCRHLYLRVEEHKSSAVGVHFKNCHKSLKHFDTNFTVLRQCKTKFDSLVYEMLFIKELKPSLNVQSDSLKTKIFQRSIVLA